VALLEPAQSPVSEAFRQAAESLSATAPAPL
jgi:hypothetical protein